MRRVIGSIRLCLALAGFLSHRLADGQPASVPDLNAWAPNGPVFAAVETNGVLYIGGRFTQIGPVTGAFAAVDRRSGKAVPPFPLVSGSVNCAIPDNVGGFYIGGNFGLVGGFPLANLAHLGTNQSFDTNFVVNVDGEVNALALYGNRIFVGGGFGAINGQAVSFLAAIDTVTGQVASFPVTTDDRVSSMAVVDHILFLGGAFTHVGGLSRNHIASVDLATSEVTTWNPALDSTLRTGVRMIQIAHGRVYAGGDFTQVDGAPRFALAAFDASSGALLPWDARISRTYATTGVSALAVSSNVVYIAGVFDRIGGLPRNVIGAVDEASGAVLPWNPGINLEEANALAADGNMVYVGGSYPGIGSNGPSLLAAVDASSGVPLANWVPAPGGEVKALLVDGRAVYAGGSFNSIGGVARSVVCAVDLTTGRPTDWNPQVGAYYSVGNVTSLCLRGDALYIGGYFFSIGGQLRGAMGAVALADAHVLPFSPLYGGYINGIVAAGSNIVATSLGQAYVMDAITGSNNNWSFEADGSIDSVAASGTTLYVAGRFTHIFGQPRNGLAAFDANTRQLLAWRPLVDNRVSLVLPRDQSVIAVGDFLNANGQPRLNVAVFDSVTAELGLGPTALVVNGGIRSLTASSNAIYLAGDFTQVNGSNVNYFAAIDLVQGVTRAWNPGVAIVPGGNPNGWCSVVTPQSVVIGGIFGRVGGNTIPGMAVFPMTNLPPLVQVLTPTNQTIVRAPAQIPIEVEADSPTGIARTDIYVNTNLLLSLAAPRFSTNWIVPKHVGAYVLTAVAYDQFGEFGLSTATRVTVVPPSDYVPPTIGIISPSNNVTYPPYSTIPVTASIVAPKSAIEFVLFRLGTNIVATHTQAPYQIVLTNMQPGTYSVSAELQDEFGIGATNGLVTFFVNSPPRVTLQMPTDGDLIDSGGNLQLVAAATDANDSIDSVTFLSSDTSLGVARIAPYSLVWSNIPAGHYALQAIAQDSFGSRATSAIAHITVSLLRNGGFETGDFSGWTLAGSTNTDTVFYNDVRHEWHSGRWGALLGDTQMASLSQTFSTIPGQSYLLSLWIENPSSGAVQQFRLNWNTNSSTTNTLFDIVNPPAFSWTNLQFFVSATDSNSTLQIQAENDPNCFVLDDVSITPIPLPAFQTSAISAEGFRFTWATIPGLAYQVQFKTDLLQAVWTDLGSKLRATGYIATMMDTNAPGSTQQRFYRLAVSP
jgi:trimeric autotransporter adhesin